MGKKSKAAKAAVSGKGVSKGAVADEKKIKQKLSEIDDLFASAKEKKKRQMEEIKDEEAAKKQKIDEEVSSDEEEDEEGDIEEEEKETGLPYGVIKSGIKDKKYHIPVTIISPDAPLERIDKETGLPVYKAHLLKVGEGGGTPLCPFDCDCCF